jgi:hypothetical protein
MEQPETPAEKTESTESIEEPLAKQEQQAAKPGLKRHINKRNAWIAGGLIILLIISGLLLWRSRRAGYTKQFTIEGWHEVSVQSDEIAGITKGDPSLEKTNELSSSLRKLNGTMKDQKINLTLIPLLLNDRRTIDTYRAFVDKMSPFAVQVASMSDDVSAISEDDISAAQTMSTAAKDQTAQTKKELSYLTETINDALFNVDEYLASLKQLSDEAKEKAAAEVKSKKQQAEQDALDKQLVDSSITGFMDGYIAGDATKMKRYMTTEFAKEYNFDQLSADSRKYNYPASYRIVSNTKADATAYTIQVNVLYKYRNSESEATNQYTSSYSYGVVYVASSGRWLVNTEKSN